MNNTATDTTSTAAELTAPVLPEYTVDITYGQVRDMFRENEMTVSARGSQTFVTRITEATAAAFEEEATR